jgi:hypothetical protein
MAYHLVLITERCFSDLSRKMRTNSIELSYPSEAASCATDQECTHISWNPKVHYCVHKSPPLFPILIQINPVHTTSSCLFKIHLNIILPPTFVFLVVPFLLAFPPKSYMHSSSPYAWYVPSPSHPSWLYYSNYTRQRVCYEVPHYAVFSNLISLHLSSV